ncbi:MAG: SDR family oxidoreductase [Rhodothermales bacterium]|nr:SDR family oxidoreductase [Rhodothermales bacterium]
MSMVDFESKLVVVTGADGNLGTRVVKAFSDKGARVVRVVRKKTGRETDTFACDVTSEASVQDCFEEIGNRYGSIFCLVHTVGMWSMSPIIETSLESWRSMMAVNLDSTFLCFREAIRIMDSTGRLLAIASRQGADGGAANQAAYSASKGGLVRLVESTAAEYAGTQITVNAIAPYQISTGPGKPGASPEDIAGTCVFLCSAHAASISGTVIRMFG